jgi:hypothetical protein
VHVVGRSLPAYLAFLAPLGLSGCLLFTDPINKAPDVSINGPAEVTRGIPTNYTATVTDDRDDPALFILQWAKPDAKNQGCNGITPADLASKTVASLDRSVPYAFTAQDTNIACLCVQATDRDGASSFACQRITPVNVAPEAVITDVSGASSGQTRPLCSQIELSAEESTFPADDHLQFNWVLTYSGTDPNGKLAQLAACDGKVANLADAHRVCFSAAAPGAYTVTLSITDTPPAPDGGAADALSSNLAEFKIPVNVDTPPCLQQTDPDKYSLLTFLSRRLDDSRTFTVLSVADDCEPYPPLRSSKQPAQFVWSVYDATSSSPKWVYQANTTNAFTVTSAMYPSTLPGDTIKVRVEVRDSAVPKLTSACPSDQTDICCGANACTGSSNDCVRWTTWTVGFQPP